MSTKTRFLTLGPSRAVAAAALASLIAIGMFWSVAHLFHSRGKPMERLAAAERVCAPYAYESERQACMKQWIADNQQTRVARH